MRTAAFVAGICWVMSSLVGPDAYGQNTMERIRSTGAVVIGHRESSIPFSYIVDGKPLGYTLDVCQRMVEAIARNLQVKSLSVKYKLVTPANRFEMIESGDIDLECGSTTNNAARRKRAAFTIAHFVSSARLMVLTDSKFERVEDLDGKVVASTKGSSNFDSIGKEALLKSITLRIVPSKDHAEGVSWVIQGKVDAVALDDVLLFSLRATSERPERLKVIGKPITIEPYAIAFSKDDALLKRIADAEMRRLIASGEIFALYSKWFENPIPPKGVNLAMRMPYLLRDSLRYPTDFVPN